MGHDSSMGFSTVSYVTPWGMVWGTMVGPMVCSMGYPTNTRYYVLLCTRVVNSERFTPCNGRFNKKHQQYAAN